MPTPARNPGSVALTSGIRIAVAPSYLPEHSDPSSNRFVFGYRIRISNESPHPVKLLSRRWVIVDAQGERHDVEGEGVVGQQPEIAPGDSFSYASFCPLGTPWGTMEGVYTMQAADGQTFEAQIGRFFLVHPDQEAGSSA